MSYKINFTHEDSVAEFVKDNIVSINKSIKAVKSELKAHPNTKFDDTDIKNHLHNKFISELESNKGALLAEFEAGKFTKTTLTDIANKYIYYKNDLENFYQRELFKDLFENTPNNLDSLVTDFIESKSTVSKAKKKYIASALKNIVGKSTVLIKQNGFANNINNIESGVQTANAGDSAQFLFVSRAILAGFNCSNVDVRSSRYDAVIDYCGEIFKVQVKGMSGNTVSFKDRDRGGRGIDTHNERNRGKRITSKDCDIYVAVDKQVGICYIIPMESFVDKLDEKEIKSCNVGKLIRFRENWDIISEVYSTATRFKYSGSKLVETISENLDDVIEDDENDDE